MAEKDKGTPLNKETWVKPGGKKLQLLKGIFKIAGNAVTGNWLDVPGNAADAVQGLKLADPGTMGWRLISRALTDAALNLIIENNRDFTRESIVVDQLDKDLNALLENETFFMGFDFFKNPGKLPFLEKAKPVFEEFFKLCGFDDTAAGNMVNRLGSYFVFSLVNEWRRKFTRSKFRRSKFSRGACRRRKL